MLGSAGWAARRSYPHEIERRTVVFRPVEVNAARDVSDKRARLQRHGALRIEFSCADPERALEHRHEAVVVVKVRHAPRVRADASGRTRRGPAWKDRRTDWRSCHSRCLSIASGRAACSLCCPGLRRPPVRRAGRRSREKPRPGSLRRWPHERQSAMHVNGHLTRHRAATNQEVAGSSPAGRAIHHAPGLRSLRRINVQETRPEWTQRFPSNVGESIYSQ